MTDLQLEITTAQIIILREALDEHEKSTRPENIHPILWEAEHYALLSQIHELKGQINGYIRPSQ